MILRVLSEMYVILVLFLLCLPKAWHDVGSDFPFVHMSVRPSVNICDHPGINPSVQVCKTVSANFGISMKHHQKMQRLRTITPPTLIRIMSLCNNQNYVPL